VANDRESSKQKRARANRAQREALAARTQAASTPRPSRAAPAAGGAKATPTRRSSRVSRPPASDDAKADRPVRTRPLKPGDVPVDIDELEGSHIRKVIQVPGGRYVLTGLVATAALSAFSLTQKTLPPEGADPKAKDLKYTRTYIDAYGAPKAILLISIPVLIVALGVIFGLTRHRRRIWIMIAVLLGVLVLQGAIFYIFPCGMVGYGAYRAAKVEGPGEPLFGRRRAAAAEADDDLDEADED
jgi:hypothetical protein